MKQQNYKNYRKFYIPHHFIFLPLLFCLMVYGAYQYFNDPGKRLEWALLGILSFCILYLALMVRQHYALGNQNRIVRLEFRLRYWEITGRPAKEIEHRLSFSQIAALRFAADHEFPVLLERALNERLSADEIKRSVRDWQADDMRV